MLSTGRDLIPIFENVTENINDGPGYHIKEGTRD